jgi:hypothetical protein
MIVKLALFWPARTVTLRGTLATDGPLLVRDTNIPDQGAAPLKTTVPLELAPPTTLVGVRVSEAMLVAALAEPGANTEMAIKVVNIAITNISPFCLHIFPFLPICRQNFRQVSFQHLVNDKGRSAYDDGVDVLPL